MEFILHLDAEFPLGIPGQKSLGKAKGAGRLRGLWLCLRACLSTSGGLCPWEQQIRLVGEVRAA